MADLICVPEVPAASLAGHQENSGRLPSTCCANLSLPQLVGAHVVSGGRGTKAAGAWGKKIEAQSLRDLGLKVARCPAACPFSNWRTRVRIQEPGHTIKGSGSRGGSGEARGPECAEPFLALSFLPRPAEPGPPQPRRPGRGTRPRNRSWCSSREEGPSLQPTTRPAAWSSSTACRTSHNSVLGRYRPCLARGFFFFLRQKKGT